jgi:tRNA pseudouridine55 synthase
MTMGDERLFIGVADIDEDGRVAPKRLVVFRDEEIQTS